ncbi:glycosyltransferase involved in cell wall biosynthesis [Wenyingzhuangia heitensis]|uniref:Glycosyltransferase involved in cell wall biosynthesis n=1 Tax=Wenyingzhuangia heitensis TaxID=1487859 RepID=A0ABX0U9C1_9FLAO|nr:glycosyltransferase [Wenyingzhuangia heitensis]NIJ45442.1 glycosyltransferase involved in cell wall biosynthesis [Wenyingzhuangia heitensis]
MKFGIITHAVHKIKDGQIYAYEPYVREMNLWASYVDEVLIVAPVSKEKITDIEVSYKHTKIRVVPIPNFDITTFKNLIRSLFVIPKICWIIYKVMKEVNHIHLRCPGNIGLLGCLVQILFPLKPKTAKYAGNWDPESKQPVTYRVQKWLLSNTYLTKNIKVLVYGDWPNQSKNIIPFFTASYHQNEIVEISKKELTGQINLIFVGGLTVGKQPLISVKSTHQLIQKGYNVVLNIYGDGIKRTEVEEYIKINKLEENVILHGNVAKDVVKSAFQQSHFLIFISKSEGWPKVVAEAMFWECLPITTKVSCVPYMLGNNTRGQVVNSKIDEVVSAIESYIKNKDMYLDHTQNAKDWSREYTLEKFENELKKILDA